MNCTKCLATPALDIVHSYQSTTPQLRPVFRRYAHNSTEQHGLAARLHCQASPAQPLALVPRLVHVAVQRHAPLRNPHPRHHPGHFSCLQQAPLSLDLCFLPQLLYLLSRSDLPTDLFHHQSIRRRTPAHGGVQWHAPSVVGVLHERRSANRGLWRQTIDPRIRSLQQTNAKCDVDQVWHPGHVTQRPPDSWRLGRQ
jgi:hypothetical protein